MEELLQTKVEQKQLGIAFVTIRNTPDAAATLDEVVDVVRRTSAEEDARNEITNAIAMAPLTPRTQDTLG